MQEASFQMSVFELVDKPITLLEGIEACILQVSLGFINRDKVKHMSLCIFGYTKDHIEMKEIEVRKVASAENIADVFIKALLTF